MVKVPLLSSSDGGPCVSYILPKINYSQCSTIVSGSTDLIWVCETLVDLEFVRFVNCQLKFRDRLEVIRASGVCRPNYGLGFDSTTGKMSTC
jgi:hypothetical protein